MTLMRFDSGAVSLQFQVGGSYPSSGPVQILGVQDRTAAGTFQYERLGLSFARRAIRFQFMPTADYEALVNWFLNVAQGGANSFTFTDEYGAQGEVVITDTGLNFQEDYLGRWSGTLNLEYITPPALYQVT